METAFIDTKRELTPRSQSVRKNVPMAAQTTIRRSKANVALWVAQGLLAVIFLFAGALKLAMPLAVLAQMSPLPALLLKFVGTCECLGALGLILPGLTRVRPMLTSLAASGLVIIMISATVATLVAGPAVTALIPLLVGVLAGTVAYFRSRVVPLAGSSRLAEDRVPSYELSENVASA